MINVAIIQRLIKFSQFYRSKYKKKVYNNDLYVPNSSNFYRYGVNISKLYLL